MVYKNRFCRKNLKKFVENTFLRKFNKNQNQDYLMLGRKLRKIGQNLARLNCPYRDHPEG